MDLVAHCGSVNRGSYVHTLVMTDIASGWTEAAPIVVREGSLVVETLERVRVALPFPLRALDVDNGSEFVNDRLIEYCLSHGIELTRSRPYRKNDQAWIEQKNGAIVRKLIGYRRFEGLAAARAITLLYAASRLFVNFFQPSFKLASKQRDGAKVTKRYHPPQTPCERLLQAESIALAAKSKLREISANLDPLKLLEEIRAMQAYLAALADGDATPPVSSEPPNLAAFVASLSSAWHMGEIRPTFSADAKRRYLRGLERIPASDPSNTAVSNPFMRSLAKPGSRHFAWHGPSFAGDLKASQTLTPRSSSTNCASNSLADSLQGNTRPSCGASTCGVEMHSRVASLLGPERIDCAVTNRGAAVLRCSKSIGGR